MMTAIRNPQSEIRNDVVRRPVVAGYYYPTDPRDLAGQIDALTSTAQARPAQGVIVPHGSYRHSGAIAGTTFASVVIPRRCILLGPSHTGGWSRWSVMTRGAYRTPLGDIRVEEAGAAALRDRCPFLEPDHAAQSGEHALELQLPFLQRLGPEDLRIIPVIVETAAWEELASFADALAQVVRMCEEPVLLIASADLSHYEPLPQARAHDQLLLEAIRDLDGRALMETLGREQIVMCGAAAVACVVEASRRLNAREATCLAYGTSAEAGGDPHAVTGYAGVVIR